MDYFKQRRAYRNFKLVEASVSNGQNNLYRELLDYANDSGKLDVQFPVKNSALISLTGLSEPGLDKARNQLVQYGLIEYVKGRKNVKAPEYRIINLTSMATGYPTSKPTRNEKSRVTSLDKVGQPVGQPGGLLVGHKVLTNTDSNLTSTDKVVVDGTPPHVDQLQAFDLWQQVWGFPNAVASEDLNNWVKAFGDELVCFAIKYAAKRDVQAKGADHYLERVFDGYRKQQIDTVEKAEIALKQHQQVLKANSPRKSTGSGGYKRQGRVEKLPAWSAPDYKPDDAPISEEQQQKLAALNEKLKQQKEAAKE